MTLNMRTAALLVLLVTAGIGSTPDRADAQVYYSGTGTYYYYTPPSAVYFASAVPETGYSYYTPAGYGNGTTLANGSSNNYPAPYPAWDGGWAIPNYTSPAYSAYANYRATRGGFRR